MTRPREETLMDVMGRMLFWAIALVAGAVLVIAVAPLAIIPIVLALVIAGVVWHEAKVPLAMPSHKPGPPRPPHTPPAVKRPRPEPGASYVAPAPLELEAELSSPEPYGA